MPRSLAAAIVGSCFVLSATAQGHTLAVVTEGRVVDQLGEPLGAVEVHARIDGKTVARTVSDGEGTYLLRSPGEVDLAFAAAGKVTARLPWRGPLTPRVRNVVLEDGGRLHGRVLDANNAPVANAIVFVVAGRESEATTSDRDGAFTFAALPMQRAIVRAVASDSWVECELRIDPDTQFDVRLPAQRNKCLVRVDALPAEAVAGAMIRVWGPDLAAVQNGGRIALRPDGTVPLPLTGSCLVEAVVPGFATTPVLQVVSPRAPSIEFAVVKELPPAERWRVQGRVRTTTGKAVGGVSVLVRDRLHRELGTVRVNDDGTFASAVKPSVLRECRFGIGIGPWFVVDDEESVTDGCSWTSMRAVDAEIEIVVEPAARLRTIVRGLHGEPLPLADIVAVRSAAQRDVLLRTCSDRTGAVDVSLPAGEIELLAVTADGRVSRAALRLDARKERAFEWTPVPTGEIAGRVLDAVGKPVASLELWVCAEALQEEGSLHAAQRQRCVVVTDREGRFRARGLPAGVWTVAAPHDDRATTGGGVVVAGEVKTVDLGYAR